MYFVLSLCPSYFLGLGSEKVFNECEDIFVGLFLRHREARIEPSVFALREFFRREILNLGVDWSCRLEGRISGETLVGRTVCVLAYVNLA